MRKEKKVEWSLIFLSALIMMLGLVLYRVIGHKIIVVISCIIDIVLGIITINYADKNKTEIEKIELNDERNIMIRHKAHETTNNIMVLIQGVIGCVVLLLGYPWVGILMLAFSIGNIITLCLSTSYFNKRL